MLHLSLLQLIEFYHFAWFSCNRMISIRSTKRTVRTQSCKPEKTVHKGSLLVLGVTALCSMKYARAFSLAGMEFVTRLVWGEQREARWKAWQTPFFFLHWVIQRLQPFPSPYILEKPYEAAGDLHTLVLHSNCSAVRQIWFNQILYCGKLFAKLAITNLAT